MSESGRPFSQAAILLHNDDATPFAFVVELLADVFRMPKAEGASLALRVHKEGSAVVAAGDAEVVEALVAVARHRVDEAGFKLIFSVADVAACGRAERTIGTDAVIEGRQKEQPSVSQCVRRFLRLGLRALFFRRIDVEDLRSRGPEPVIMALLAVLVAIGIGWLSLRTMTFPQPWGLTAFAAVTALLGGSIVLVRGRKGEFDIGGALSVVLAASLWAELAAAMLRLAWVAAGARLPVSDTAQIIVAMVVPTLSFLWYLAALGVVGIAAMRPRRARGAIGFVAAGLAALLLLPSTPIVPMPYDIGSRGLLQAAYDLAQPELRDDVTVPVHRNIDVEAAYERQPRVLKSALDGLQPSRPGRSEIYFVAAAAYGDQDVFMREARSARQIFDERMQTTGRSVLLVNNADTLDELPLANATNLGHVMDRLAEIMDPNKDVLVLFLTSHGGVGKLSTHFGRFSFNDLSPDSLSRILARSRIKHRAVILSACYSGSFISGLEDERTLVIAAAASDRTSFGCSNEREWTFFGDAYFNHGLRQTRSLVDAFAIAEGKVKEWETRDKLDPSQPQMAAGAAVSQRLETIARNLGVALGGNTAQPDEAPASSASETAGPAGSGATR